MDPKAGLDDVEKILGPNSDLLIVQPVTSRYTDYAIPFPHILHMWQSKNRQDIMQQTLTYCDMSIHCWVALLVSRHRPVNKVPRRRDDVTCVYVVARRRAAILSDRKGNGRRDVTVLLNNAMTVTRRPLIQLGYISEAISRFSSVPGVTVKKSVFKKQLYETVVK
jgi:hypothetical protein